MSSTEQQMPEENRGKVAVLKRHLKVFTEASGNLFLNLLAIGAIVWGVMQTWKLIRGTHLITEETTTTLVQMDLLQFFAFIVAWSALLMSGSAWITNWLIKQTSTIERSAWEREKMDEKLDQHMAEHPDLENQSRELEGQTPQAEERLGALLEEIRRLKKENTILRELNY